jgi:hypothetical protein
MYVFRAVHVTTTPTGWRAQRRHIPTQCKLDSIWILESRRFLCGAWTGSGETESPRLDRPWRVTQGHILTSAKMHDSFFLSCELVHDCPVDGFFISGKL